MQISLAKRRLSGPARTFIAPLRHSKAAAWDSRRCGACDRMNIQNISSSRWYNRLHNRLQSVYAL